jgi:hypothetical protein
VPILNAQHPLRLEFQAEKEAQCNRYKQVKLLLRIVQCN